MKPEDKIWIAIEKDNSDPDIGHYKCIYDVRTGYIIFRISEFKGQEVLDKYQDMEEILKDVCLNWDDTIAYDYHRVVIPIRRDRKLDLLLNDEEGI